MHAFFILWKERLQQSYLSNEFSILALNVYKKLIGPGHLYDSWPIDALLLLTMRSIFLPSMKEFLCMNNMNGKNTTESRLLKC